MANKLKKACYVVFVGREPGIYTSWADCQRQVHRFADNNFKGFATRSGGETAWEQWKASAQNRTAASRDDRTRLPLAVTNAKNALDYDVNDKSRMKMPAAARDSPSENDNEDLPKRIRHDSVPEMSSVPEPVDPDPIVLNAEQAKVVRMALNGQNIFLTGAAGSGKTATLRAIMKGFDQRKAKYQVVAPTGIAALPLEGKTTYSFLGWKHNSMHLPIEELQDSVKKYIRKAVRRVQILIVEEISMVENQFLERMNLLLQTIKQSPRPFGGMQIIFLGDFHQLPPVKPFETCLQCGNFMSGPPRFDTYECKECPPNRRIEFSEDDKWAFKAPVWSQANLLMLKLEQIHRQKDSKFQDILNYIRNGIRLSDEEWHDLEATKILPNGICPVRLMSKRSHVKEENTRELVALGGIPTEWECYDTYKMITEGPLNQQPWKIRNPLEGSTLAENLQLKFGAKVILLTNITNTSLVNGSQGVVVGFQPYTGEDDKKDSSKGSQSESCAWDAACLERFRSKNISIKHNQLMTPIIQFADGRRRPIYPITQTRICGTNDVKYLASRTQYPLALAWALSIHKSQGMTLNYVEVSSKHIFERGQLYVALSRATSLDGLIVTGTTREQLEVDSAVVEFYENTEWEDLSSPLPVGQ